MINLEHYQDNSFEFYSTALSRKKDSDLKARLDEIRNEISVLFIEYTAAFSENNLAQIENRDFTTEQRGDLLELYKYGSTLIQKLKTILTTDDHNRILNTCQNCTINSVNSFDHILPKTEFPQYAVNPLNLFPSCTQCNGKKSVNWINENGEFRFLNLYLDILPHEQYLFVDFDFSNNSVNCTFRLNQGAVNDELFNKINRHYLDLDLLKRFQIETHRVITELINSVEGNRNNLTNEELAQFVINTENRNKITFGNNYWESILKQSIVGYDRFWQLF